MIRILTFLVAIVCVLPVVNAQEFKGGIYGSLAISQLDGDLYSGYDKFGYAGGGYVTRFLRQDRFAFQMGLRYIQKGSRAKNNYYKSKLHYVEMPLTVLVKLNNKSKIRVNGNAVNFNRFFFEAGATVGYLVKSFEEEGGYEILDPPPFNNFEIGFIGGVSYELTEKLNMGFHFLYSILFVRPYSQDFNTMNEGQHNNLLTLTLAYNLK